MFETYYYIDEEKINDYLSDFSRPNKLKNKKLCAEISLPFIKITSSGEYSKDICELSTRQKAVLLESILHNNELNFYFDLHNPEVDITTIQVNTFVKLTCNFKVPEMIDMINGLGSLLSGKLGDFTQEQITLSQDENSAKIVFKLFSEKHLSVPIVITNNNAKFISEINIDTVMNCDELEFWDEVAEECEVIAKVTRCYKEDLKVNIFDIGKSYFGLTRTLRRQIPNYENYSRYNIFEENVKFKFEILAIRK